MYYTNNFPYTISNGIALQLVDGVQIAFLLPNDGMSACTNTDYMDTPNSSISGELSVHVHQ